MAARTNPSTRGIQLLKGGVLAIVLHTLNEAGSFVVMFGTITALPRPTPAAILAVALFMLGRLVFVLWPDAFTPYPETQAEYNFYKLDLKCKAAQPEAQLVVQGTSRSVNLQEVPVFEKRWHTRDRMLNISQPLNTYWNMNLLHRRNPGLLDKADFWVMDVVPVQLYFNYGFTEREPLFLRESTLDERLRVTSSLNRMWALAEMVVPLQSHHHSVANWLRAASTLRATPQARLDALLAINAQRLPDIQGEQKGVVQLNPTQIQDVFADISYPSPAIASAVQVAAFHELLARRPAKAEALFVHFPMRPEFRELLRRKDALPTRDALRAFLQQATSDHVHLDWFNEQDEMGLADSDYSPDGFHPSLKGMNTVAKYIAKRYRQLVPLSDDTPRSTP